jgi:hypothetical protein
MNLVNLVDGVKFIHQKNKFRQKNSLTTKARKKIMPYKDTA